MSVIQVKYAELLSISIEQAFYTNLICGKYKVEPSLDLLLSPSSECTEVMKRFDMVFRNTDTTGGCTVLARVLGNNLGGDDLLRFKPRKGEKLSFHLYLANAEMIDFNDLPTLGNDQLFYFSNQLTDALALRNNLHLSQDASSVKTLDVKKKTGGTYRFQHSAEIVPSSEKVKHVLTGAEVGSKSLINQNGKSDMIFDLSILPTGVCQLLINNTVTDEFYYQGNLSPRPLFGVIELILSPEIASNYRVTEQDGSLSPTRPHYKMQFVNRPTLWRYTLKIQPTSSMYREMSLLSPSDKADFLNRLNIVTNDTSITFQKISATDTEFVFVSDNVIGLQENYTSSTSLSHENLSLSLKKYIGNLAKEAAVKTDLPYPNPSSLNTSNFPIIYSDTFITI